MKAKLIISLLYLFVFTSYSQNRAETYGNNSSFIFNGGLSVWGPEITFGGFYNQTYGEWYFIYHAFDYEGNESIWNKPTSGGFLLGFNFIFNYNTESRLKYFVGIGAQKLNERLGKNAYYSSGDPKEGYLQGYEIHGGLRYFITKQFFFSGWLGFFISQDKSEAMLTKRPTYGTPEWGPLTLDLSIMYEF